MKIKNILKRHKLKLLTDASKVFKLTYIKYFVKEKGKRKKERQNLN